MLNLNLRLSPESLSHDRLEHISIDLLYPYPLTTETQTSQRYQEPKSPPSLNHRLNLRCNPPL